MVVAPDSELAAELVAGSTDAVKAEFAAYLTEVQKKSEIDRQDASREKTGVFLDRFAVNPVNGERLPDVGGGLRARRLRPPAPSWPCPPTTSATSTSR
jgi:leucyl-tRNA synthetase